MNRVVYLDYAATTPLDIEVKKTMINLIESEFGNPSSIHHHGRKARTIVEQARKTLAECIQASIGEVFFTSGATESNNMVISGAISCLGVERIISTRAEHHCVSHCLEHVESANKAEVVYLPLGHCGSVDPNQLESVLAESDKKTMVTLMHGNNEIGTLLDLDTIAGICQTSNALFHTDTAQTLSKYPIDVQKTPINFLTGSGHKVYGPKGIGMVYINNNNQIQAQSFGGSQERNMRPGTENIYGIAGFAKAIERAMESREDRYHATKGMRQYFLDQLMNLNQDVKVNGTDCGMAHVCNVSFPKSDKNDMIMFNLDINGICVSAGSACSSGVSTPSHVLQAIGHDIDRKAVRFSFSHLTTKDEVDYVIEKIKSLL